MSRWQDVEGKKVYIGNLDSGVTTDDIEKLFSKYGSIQSVWVARNPPGFAFVTYDDENDAQDAVHSLDGTKFNKKQLRVEIAKGPRNANKVPADWKLREKNKNINNDKKFNENGLGGVGTSYRRSPSYGRYERDEERYSSKSSDEERGGRRRRRNDSSDSNISEKRSRSRSRNFSQESIKDKCHRSGRGIDREGGVGSYKHNKNHGRRRSRSRSRSYSNERDRADRYAGGRDKPERYCGVGDRHEFDRKRDSRDRYDTNEHSNYDRHNNSYCYNDEYYSRGKGRGVEREGRGSKYR